MAIRDAPRRELQLNSIHEDTGGVRAYVHARLKQGHAVEDIATHFTHNDGVTLSAAQLYKWILRWKKEDAQEGADHKARKSVSRSQTKTAG